MRLKRAKLGWFASIAMILYVDGVAALDSEPKAICAGGMWGDKCERPCYKNCATPKCYQVSGYCVEGCVSGFFGARCEFLCSNCEGSCDQHTSNCNNGCKTGFHGRSCTKRCPVGCKDGCDQNGLCHSCHIQWHGSTCERRCEENCRSGCHQGSGNCKACQAGYTGDLCKATCGQCSTTECDQHDARCSNCIIGYHGVKCDQACPAHCQCLWCDQEEGLCQNGCDAGFQGASCEEEEKSGQAVEAVKSAVADLSAAATVTGSNLPPNLPIVFGFVFGLAALVVIIVAGMLIYTAMSKAQQSLSTRTAGTPQ